ncbi:unnamed protein product [Brachionus calyciflorus]|uniref:Uncharacterized protein n=1 Tax=Brachionus calyciflorus TaxID=104777 RepID=A0A813UFA9_9BILA|nr:unnamed protein product [Brachionus calyciflorus]
MVRTTPFNGQLKVCGRENFTSCSVQIKQQPNQAAQIEHNPPNLNHANPEPVPIQAAEATPAAAPVIMRPNVTINLNAYRLLREIIGGRLL